MMNRPVQHAFSRRVRVYGAAVALFVGVATLGLVPSAQADTAPPVGLPATLSADVLPTWQLDGVVWSTVTVGNTTYATGSFSTARPPGVAAGGVGQIPAGNIFAFDITTGERISTFDHTLNAQGLSLAKSPDGTRVYVVGDFTEVDGQERLRVAAFDTATGALVSDFAPRPLGQVAAVAATDSTVYFGGSFNSVGGAVRGRLAAVNAADGVLTDWAPTADDQAVKTMVVAPDGSRLIVGGQFTTLNNVAAYGMGALSTTTGAVLPWAATNTIRTAGINGGITSLRTDGTLIYGSTFAFGAGAKFEGTFAANPLTGVLTFLNDCHGDTYDLLPMGQVLYTVGHAHDCAPIREFPDTAGPRIHHRALAFTTYATTTNTGPDSYGWNFRGQPASTLLHWYPTLTAGTVTGQGQAAWAMSGNDTYVVLGGEFPSVNGVAQSGLVRFAVPSAAPNTVVPQASANLLPRPTAVGAGSVKVNWTSTWDMDNEFLTYRLQRDGVTIYNSPASASSFWELPVLSYLDTGLEVGSTHTYKIQARDAFNNVKYTGASAVVTVS
jgi:hypothetical protein